MVSLRKRGPGASINPVRSHLDEQWFDDYWSRIIKRSRIDPDDDGNRIELILFTLTLLDSAARDYMSQLNDQRALAVYEAAMQDPGNCTAEGKAALIVGWNSQALRLLEEKLDKFFGILVSAGLENGRLRFFWTECHGEHRSYPAGRPICSVCHQPAEF